MLKLKNLAALAAAVEAARRYARSNPDKAAQYLDQAAAFLDKQTAQALARSAAWSARSRVPPACRRTRDPGLRDERSPARARGLRRVRGVPGPADDDGAVDHPPPVNTPPTRSTVDPERTGDRPFPGSKDL